MMSIAEHKNRDIAPWLPSVRGSVKFNAPLGATSWMGVGGAADILFKPEDEDDLAVFLAACPSEIPMTIIGATSNLLIRDGGIKGVVIRLGRGFNTATILPDHKVDVGAAMPDMNLAQFAQKNALGGLEFFSGIPGTIGGALFMNAGAYHSETKDVLHEAIALDRTGKKHRLNVQDLDMRYRHTNAEERGLIFTRAILNAYPDDGATIAEKIEKIREARHATQPIKARTGGSTFANPTEEECRAAGMEKPMRAWEVIDAVGGRGLTIGGAMMSEKHCNFMINECNATAADFEKLGEELRHRVQEKFGLTLRWEIRRIGEKVGGAS